jgi:hypothetical protein
MLKRRKKLGIPPANVRTPIKPMMRRGMTLPLPKLLAEKAIGDLAADEFLSAARRIIRLRRSGRSCDVRIRRGWIVR